jgi:nucleotide-binding universal stress UspA family protein
MPSRAIIVFPTDFSPLSLVAIPWLKRLQQVLDADVHCITVVQQPPAFSMLELGTVPLPTEAELLHGAELALRNLVQRHLGEVRVTAVRVVAGRPAEGVVDYAREAAASLIVLTTHGRGGLRHAVLGSTAEAILRRATCPVLSVRGEPQASQAPLLVAATPDSA